MKKLFILTAVLLTSVCTQAQQPPLVYETENTGINANPVLPTKEQGTKCEALPDPLMWSDGSGRITDFKDWSLRRGEIAKEIQHYEIGTKPAVDPSAVKARMDGDTLKVTVTVGEQSLELSALISYPTMGEAPYPLMIGTSGIALPKSIFEKRPIATMIYKEAQVNNYSQFGARFGRKPAGRGNYDFDRLYPELKDNGAYSEWAWGLSRLIDGLQQLGSEVTKIDTKHIGVTGCSYAGKMALFCGAFDERVALTIAQEPGGGGAAAWRKSHESTEKVEDIDKTDYHWFMESQRDNFRGDSVYRLPYDQHELCAMVCPRALLLLGNPDYVWLSDRAMLPSAEAAKKVWERFGIGDRMGWSIVGGHGHCQLPERQWPKVQAFIDRFLLGRPANTANIQIAEF